MMQAATFLPPQEVGCVARMLRRELKHGVIQLLQRNCVCDTGYFALQVDCP
jgi:hypothetical protein